MIYILYKTKEESHYARVSTHDQNLVLGLTET